MTPEASRYVLHVLHLLVACALAAVMIGTMLADKNDHDHDV